MQNHVLQRSLLMMFSLMVLLLIGCTANKHSSSTQLNAAACKSSCANKFNACTKVCKNDCQQCEAFMQAGVARHYANFIHQQLVQGGLLAREVNSYRDPQRCLKTTCDCRADYNECTQACSGVIHKRLQVPTKCC